MNIQPVMRPTRGAVAAQITTTRDPIQQQGVAVLNCDCGPNGTVQLGDGSMAPFPLEGPGPGASLRPAMCVYTVRDSPPAPEQEVAYVTPVANGITPYAAMDSRLWDRLSQDAKDMLVINDMTFMGVNQSTRDVYNNPDPGDTSCMVITAGTTTIFGTTEGDIQPGDTIVFDVPRRQPENPDMPYYQIPGSANEQAFYPTIKSLTKMIDDGLHYRCMNELIVEDGSGGGAGAPAGEMGPQQYQLARVAKLSAMMAHAYLTSLEPTANVGAVAAELSNNFNLDEPDAPPRLVQRGSHGEEFLKAVWTHGGPGCALMRECETSFNNRVLRRVIGEALSASTEDGQGLDALIK